MAWLTDLEAGSFLVECRLLSSIPADPSWLQGLCDLARARWERDTGWRPYLVSDPADLSLRIRSNIVDLPSVLVSYDAITLDGQALTDAEYSLFGRGDCLQLSRWVRVHSGSTLAISDAVLGRETDIPTDVRDALLALSGAEYATRNAGAQGVITDVRQGDVSYRSRQSQAEAFRATYDETVRRHRRVVMR